MFLFSPVTSPRHSSSVILGELYQNSVSDWVAEKEVNPAVLDVLSHTSYTSDAGWGCMIRTSQMLLAQVLQFHFLGRDWRRSLPLTSNAPHDLVQIQRMFFDIPDKISCPLSIHNILSSGQKLFNREVVGIWFGPNEACRMIQSCLHSSYLSDYLRIFVANDRELYFDDIVNLCTTPLPNYTNESVPVNSLLPSILKSIPSIGRNMGLPLPHVSMTTITEIASRASAWISNWNNPKSAENIECEADEEDDVKQENVSFNAEDKYDENEEYENDMEADITKALLILIPMRLGLEKIHTDYIPLLFELLSMKECVGFIGGKPRSSFYFIGFEGENLFYLDPHTVQKALPINFDLCSDSSSYFSDNVKMMNVRDIDPSLALGFYCRSRSELRSFWKSAKKICGEDKYSLFSFFDRRKVPTLTKEESLLVNSVCVLQRPIETEPEVTNEEDGFVIL